MNRRNFTALLLSFPFIAPLLSKLAQAAGKEIDEKTAARIKYVADATKSTHPKYKKGDVCGTCAFYKNPKDGKGVCTMAANQLVSEKGWSQLYKKKT